MISPACPRCGVRFDLDARFCGACGDALATPPLPADGKTIPAIAVDGKAISIPAPPVSAPLDDLIGKTLNDRYIVERKIGEGGFGAVFQGTQVGTGREVALKILHRHNVADSTVVARFRREAEACSRLRSPHTVTIYDFDQTTDGILYLAMELVRGESLQQIQRREGALEARRVLRLLDQIAEALGEAHAKGIVHRDMKPENVMVETTAEGERVKVLDFGIAKIVSGDPSKKTPALTAFGQTVGTLEFMSPEQLRGKGIDGRSDIYALGIMAYEMLTGALPFKGAKSHTEVIQFHLQTVPPPPSRLAIGISIPSSVDALVLRMVAKNAAHRHATVGALRADIQDALDDLDGGRGGRREVMRVAMIAGTIAALVATAAIVASR